MLGYPQTVFISWNYISLLTFSFFPLDLSDAYVMVLFGLLAFFLILSVVEVPCLLYLPRSCTPHFFLEFSSLIFPFSSLESCLLEREFPFFSILKHLKLYMWFHPCPFLVPCIWHLLLYIQSTWDFLWLLPVHCCFSFISHPCFLAFLASPNLSCSFVFLSPQS